MAMLLAVVLLYVGAVLGVNGIWLIGQARAAAPAPAPAAAGAGGGRGDPAPAPGPTAAERSPLFLQGREVAVINIFTGFVGVVIALILLVQAAVQSNLASARGGGFILLFAFTYLWVAFNQVISGSGRAFGWYCLFVAITAVPAGIYTLQTAGGNPAAVWLGLNWFAWAVLWALFFVLLALQRPIALFVGWLAVIEGIVTAWALGFAVLIGALSF
jgi:putative amide transporter protein